MAWATIQQVQDQTGQVVHASTLALASSVIDTYAGTDPEMPEGALTARDRAVLRKATAWQAVWVANQPGYLSHRGVDYSPSSDGTSAKRNSQADQDLAPLAQRELKNLSWTGTHVVGLRTNQRPPKGGLMIDFLNESSDYWTGGEIYTPIPGASGNVGLTGWQEITGKPLTFPPDLHTHQIEEIEGLQAALAAAGGGEGGTISLEWAEITGKPTTFAPSAHTHAWASITDKPTSFAPAAHTHAIGGVEGLSAHLDALDALEASHAALSGAVSQDFAAVDGRLDTLEAGSGGGGSALVMRRGKVTSGNLALPVSPTWAAVPGTPEFVIPAAAGDYVEFSLPSMLGNFTVNFGDLAVRVGGALVRYLSSDTNTPATEGAPAFYGDQSFDRTSPVFEFVVQAGDLEGGNVTVVFATQGSGGGTIYASPDYPLKWRALNHGPVS